MDNLGKNKLGFVEYCEIFNNSQIPEQVLLQISLLLRRSRHVKSGFWLNGCCLYSSQTVVWFRVFSTFHWHEYSSSARDLFHNLLRNQISWRCWMFEPHSGLWVTPYIAKLFSGTCETFQLIWVWNMPYSPCNLYKRKIVMTGHDPLTLRSFYSPYLIL